MTGQRVDLGVLLSDAALERAAEKVFEATDPAVWGDGRTFLGLSSPNVSAWHWAVARAALDGALEVARGEHDD